VALNDSQLYYLKKMVGRKAKVIETAIVRGISSEGSAISKRIIKARISKELRLHFRIDRIADLAEDEYDAVLEMIKSYRFYYCEKYFG
jgi:hypothetical protein